VAAAVVDQVSREQQHIRVLLGVLVHRGETGIEVVVVRLVLEPSLDLGDAQIVLIDVRPHIDMCVRHVADAQCGVAMPLDEEWVQNFGGDARLRRLPPVIGRMESAVFVPIFNEQEVAVFRRDPSRALRPHESVQQQPHLVGRCRLAGLFVIPEQLVLIVLQPGGCCFAEADFMQVLQASLAIEVSNTTGQQRDDTVLPLAVSSEADVFTELVLPPG
jgi:hypothetical protein